MGNAPVYNIDLSAFWDDPYPDLKSMRKLHSVVFVPQLGAYLLCRRDDVFVNEKRIDIFSSVQPDGLMVRLMGQNMMRKDGAAHLSERKAALPTVSPRTVKNEWKAKFQSSTDEVLRSVFPKGEAELVRDIAMRISGEALKAITGLTQIDWQEMDRVSQGMIDGCANYAGDMAVEVHCNECTKAIDDYITEMMPIYKDAPDSSLLSVLMQTDMPEPSIRANIKLAISGGQNEPRDVIAGLVWTLLTHPEELAGIRKGKTSWMQAFNEYARWMSPVGMSPRRIAKPHEIDGVELRPGDRAFLMYGSANRDEHHFERPDHFDTRQDSSKSVAFGAGPHFCAGAFAAKSLIAEVALPAIFERLKGLQLAGETKFGGWAFRGPISTPIRWNTAA